MTLQDPYCLLLTPRDIRFLPATRPPAILMLDQEMRRANLTAAGPATAATGSRGSDGGVRATRK